MSEGAVNERSCPSCERHISSTARYCPHCGRPQEGLSEHQPGEGLQWLQEPPHEPAPEGSALATAARGDELREEVPWRAWEAIPVFLLSFLVTGVLGLPLLALGREQSDLSTSGFILINEVVLLLTVVFWVRKRHRAGVGSLGLRNAGGQTVGLGIVTGLGALLAAYAVGALTLAVVRAVLDRDVDAPRQLEIGTEPAGIILALLGLGVVVLAPIAEEVFFRGFLYRGLRRWAAPGTAAVFSAVVFALAHLNEPLVLPPIFILGLLFARVVEKRGTLVPAIVAHMLFNAVGFVALVLRPAA